MSLYTTTGTTGLEPATFGVTGQYSNLLNYIPFFLLPYFLSFLLFLMLPLCPRKNCKCSKKKEKRLLFAWFFYLFSYRTSQKEGDLCVYILFMKSTVFCNPKNTHTKPNDINVCVLFFFVFFLLYKEVCVFFVFIFLLRCKNVLMRKHIWCVAQHFVLQNVEQRKAILAHFAVFFTLVFLVFFDSVKKQI